MTSPGRPLPAPWVAAATDAGVPPAWIGATELYDVVPSTNDRASQLALEGAPEGTTVIGGQQTAGRGRRGRAWSSPPGAGLYFSVVFRPPPRAGHPDLETTLLTLTAGVAIAEGIARASGLLAEIKWPNDLGVVRRHEAGRRVGWRKLAGILAEGAVSGAEVQYVVLGVGINVRRSADRDVQAPVTSIEDETGAVVAMPRLWACSAAALARRTLEVRTGGPGGVLEAWRAGSPSSIGARVSWGSPAARRTGVTAGIDETGALRVESGGDVVSLVAGEVAWEDFGDVR